MWLLHNLHCISTAPKDIKSPLCRKSELVSLCCGCARQCHQEICSPFPTVKMYRATGTGLSSNNTKLRVED